MELADAQSLGFEPDRLDRIGAYLDEHYIASGRLPGLDVLVARDGEDTGRPPGGNMSTCPSLLLCHPPAAHA